MSTIITDRWSENTSMGVSLYRALTRWNFISGLQIGTQGGAVGDRPSIDRGTVRSDAESSSRTRRFAIRVIAIVAAGLVTAYPAFSRDATTGTIRIAGAVVRAMVPGAKVGGGYLTIENTGPNSDRLISATSERSQSVQVHEMSTDNGIMVMRELKDGLEIPAGERVELMPGGHHLMFMAVSKPFKQGEEVKATLIFEKAGPVEVEFAVGPIAGPLDAGHSDRTSNVTPGVDNITDMKNAEDAAGHVGHQGDPK